MSGKLLLISILAGCAPAKSSGAWDTAGHIIGDSAEDTGDQEPPRALSEGLNFLEFDGLKRSFLLHVPEDLPPGAPLVFVLHGYSDSAEAIRRYAELDAAADRDGFAVVYPQGTLDRWGYAYWEVGYEFHDGSVDDVGFLLALRDLVVADQGLDPSSVFATGMSNGGDMMYRLACEASEDFTAVAPVAGCLMGWLADSCAPSAEVSLFEIHGTDDRTTPWSGDLDGSDGYGPYYGTEDSVGAFVDLFGLEVYDEEPLHDTAPDDGSTVIAHRWSSMSGPTEVWLYEVVGGRHDWPGASGNQDIQPADEILAFFRRHI